MLFIAFGLIFGIAAAGIALFAPEALPNIDTPSLKDSLTGSFLNPEKEKIYSGEFTADLDFTGLSLRDVGKISASTSGPNSLSVNSEKLEFSDASLDVEEFSGDLSIADDLSLSGKSAEASVNGIRVTPQLGNLNLDGTLNYNSITLDLSLEEFSYDASGTLITGEDELELRDNTLVLAGFSGTFSVENKRLVISGTAVNIKIE